MTIDDVRLPLIKDDDDKSCPLKNRIRKNYRHARKWAKRTNTDCFRIYDRDIKEYPLAIDFYCGLFAIQYFSFDPENDEPKEDVKNEIEIALLTLFDIRPNVLYWRTRKRRTKTEQYEKRDNTKKFFTVHEHGVKFIVNLQDYLDTGLFLDHRQTRQIVAKMSQGKRVLNLFSYTCSFSVQAAFHGAHFTKSVDMSNTYTEWGKENFLLNSLSLKNNAIIRMDCLKFLEEEIRRKETYDIIIIDPPTLSRSKKMDQMFDIQIDYVSILSKGLQLLSDDGTIIFSTNYRKFSFDETLFESCHIDDITKKTIPFDFHNQKIHRCWTISKK